jgi:hypothetical protein
MLCSLVFIANKQISVFVSAQQSRCSVQITTCKNNQFEVLFETEDRSGATVCFLRPLVRLPGTLHALIPGTGGGAGITNPASSPHLIVTRTLALVCAQTAEQQALSCLYPAHLIVWSPIAFILASV